MKKGGGTSYPLDSNPLKILPKPLVVLFRSDVVVLKPSAKVLVAAPSNPNPFQGAICSSFHYSYADPKFERCSVSRR